MSTTTEEPSKTLAIPAIPETIVIPESAFATRDAALEQSKAVRAVFDPKSRDEAVAAIRTLKELRLQMDKFREFAKAPITAAGKKVESIVADFSKEIGCGSGDPKKGPEEKRLDALLVRYENEQRFLREKEERERQAKLEEDRLAEVERLKEITRREEEAKAALAAAQEAAAKALRARSDTGREKAAEEEASALAAATAAQEQAEALALEAEEAEMTRRQQAQEDADRQAQLAIPIPGYKPKDVWTFEVTNAWAFAQIFPDLVTIEIKKREVNEAIAAGVFDVKLTEGDKAGDWTASHVEGDTYRAAPGMRIYKEIKIR